MTSYDVASVICLPLGKENEDIGALRRDKRHLLRKMLAAVGPELDVNYRSETYGRRTMLGSAARIGSLGCATELCERWGAEVNCADVEGWTPLMVGPGAPPRHPFDVYRCSPLYTMLRMMWRAPAHLAANDMASSVTQRHTLRWMTWRALFYRPWLLEAAFRGNEAMAALLLRHGATDAGFEVGWCKSEPVLKAPGFSA